MLTKALYRKYRSRSLDEIVGQDHITNILRRAIANDRIAHAYLLTGPRGVGKTSIARIIAREINKLPHNETGTHLDIIEIDAASNNSVEDVRELRERVRMAPVSASKKIYIIDEVHMLSKPAFNALLKTLEEPPDHVVFILATTDLDKLPATIVSRVQRFTFRSITLAVAIKHLRTIADKESIPITDRALELIAVHGDGSFRDSIGLLDQLASISQENEEIDLQDVENALGLAATDLIDQLILAYQHNDLETTVQLLKNAESNGLSAEVIAQQLIHAVQPRIIDQPQLLHLAEQLLEVRSTSLAYVKLTAVLARPILSKMQPQQSAKSDQIDTPNVGHKIVKESVTTKTQQSSVHKKTNETPAETNPPKPVKNLPEKKKKATKKPEPHTDEPAQHIDWKGLLERAREKTVALSSLLHKCDYSLSGDTLTLYTGNAFSKKRLDNAKYRPILSEIVAATLGDNVIIETVAGTKPPTDKNAASVIDVMGGGVIVDVE